MYGLGQSSGMIEGRNRVDSTLGNAAYMAIYMLFHIFFLLFVSLRTKQWLVRGIYGLIMLLFIYILLETGTRGTFIGLMTGSSVSILYLIIFGQKFPEVRKAAIGVLVALVTLFGSLMIFSDTAFVQDNDAIRRIANMNIKDDLEVRGIIWNVAIEGISERPVLGWGQGNFNYVFNEKYDPRLYGQEQWFDRVHNIFFDWLIAGGVLGFVAYFGILFSVLYYVFLKPLLRSSKDEEEGFTVTERAVLLGLVVGYFTHNLVVFDNLVSYMFYAVLLAIIHSRVSREMPSIMNFTVHKDIFTNIITPVAAVALAAGIYFVHVPSMIAAQDIIVAFTAQQPDERFGAFETALSRGSFADQEITEQLAQQAISLARQPNIPNDVKETHLRFAETKIKEMIVEKPNDARLHVFFASFYRSIGQFPLAKEQIDIARTLTPNKQTVVLEQGIVAMVMNDYPAMKAYMQEAFELDEGFSQARFLYAASLLYNGQSEEVYNVIPEKLFASFSRNDLALQAANQVGARDILIDMFESRIESQPTSAQNYASLGFVYYQSGQMEEAIEILKSGVAAVPSFATTGNCYIGNLEAGNQPDKDCQ